MRRTAACRITSSTIRLPIWLARCLSWIIWTKPIVSLKIFYDSRIAGGRAAAGGRAPLQKKVTYQEIAERTGASTATISRVNRCLTYGAGGYQLILGKTKFGDEISEGNP